MVVSCNRFTDIPIDELPEITFRASGRAANQRRKHQPGSTINEKYPGLIRQCSSSRSVGAYEIPLHDRAIHAIDADPSKRAPGDYLSSLGAIPPIKLSEDPFQTSTPR